MTTDTRPDDTTVSSLFRATFPKHGRLISGVTFTYRAADPFAVEVCLSASRVTWIISRSLLLDGVTERTGDGDVVVYPHPVDQHVLVMELRSPTGELQVDFEMAAVTDWLNATLKLVPDGGEQIDWDTEIAKWTDGSSGDAL